MIQVSTPQEVSPSSVATDDAMPTGSTVHQAAASDPLPTLSSPTTKLPDTPVELNDRGTRGHHHQRHHRAHHQERASISYSHAHHRKHHHDQQPKEEEVMVPNIRPLNRPSLLVLQQRRLDALNPNLRRERMENGMGPTPDPLLLDNSTTDERKRSVFQNTMHQLGRIHLPSLTSSSKRTPMVVGDDVLEKYEQDGNEDHLVPKLPKTTPHIHTIMTVFRAKSKIHASIHSARTPRPASIVRLPTQKVQVIPISNDMPSSYPLSKFTQPVVSLAELLARKKTSRFDHIMHQIIFICILLNIGILALETCDGKNYNSSAPGYPYLPSVEFYRQVDTLFTILFTLIFIGRSIRRKNGSWKNLVVDPITWIDSISLLPWYMQWIAHETGYDDFHLDNFRGWSHQIGMLRLVRILRLAFILRGYDAFQVLQISIQQSVRPLGITFFFLFTLVMVLATAIFYAQPCYNVMTCPFTDILNSAYFIMITVATVGYGNQVPSISNIPAVVISCIAMIFGQLYFAMPLAIVGNNFDSTYERFQQNKKHQVSDSVIAPVTFTRLNTKSQRLNEIHYHFIHAWSIIQQSIDVVVQQHSYLMSLKNEEECKEEGGEPLSKQRKEEEGRETLAKQLLDRHIKIKEAIYKLLDVHMESCLLMQSFIPHKRPPRDINDSGLGNKLTNALWRAANHFQAKKSGNTDTHLFLSQTLRGRIWLTLECPDSSSLARAVNKLMVALALLSIWIFCCESVPELAAHGVETAGCRRVVEDYCKTSGFLPSLETGSDAGCFQRWPNGTSDFSTPLNFQCQTTDEIPASNCYGVGYNFGSLLPNVSSCEAIFNPAGASIICYRQQCVESEPLIDMENYWIYFEWCFGFIFLLELILRFYAFNARKYFFHDVYNIFDLMALLPFLVEFAQDIGWGIQPSYAIVSTAPSFFSVIRILKTTRILKLTRHFRGTQILAQTAKEVYQQLAIPVFFLLTLCILAGAVYYELERGTECFVGTPCIWWGKNILTPALAAGLPIGKRVMIQDRQPTLLTDMIHSLWLSFATFTTVGYGDMRPRTSLGKIFTILVALVGTIYTAMPFTLVGAKYYSLYLKHREKSAIRQAGSSSSWRGPKEGLVSEKKPDTNTPPPFQLTPEELEILHQFQAMRRTIENLLRDLDSLFGSVREQQRKFSVTTGIYSIQEKSHSVLDTILQFSEVVEKLQDAPQFYEAFLPEPTPIHTPSGSLKDIRGVALASLRIKKTNNGENRYRTDINHVTCYKI